MATSVRPLAFLVPMLVLAGCNGTEFALSIAPPAPADSTTPPNPDDPPGPGDPWDDPTGNSPWDDIEPGTLPDVYFVAAMSEWDCCWDCDGMDGAAESDLVGGCPATYAVIDLDGQVVSEFTIPVDETQWPEPEWAPIQHLSLAPAGPGRFMAVVENWAEAWTGAGGDELDEDGSAFWLSPSIQIWLFDAVAGTSELLAEMTDDGRMLELRPNGRRVPLDGASVAMTAAWPDRAHPRLAVWSGNTTCGGIDSLRSVDLVEPRALDWTWQTDLLLDPESELACRYWPWTLQSGIDEGGEPSFLLGNVGTYQEEGAPAMYELTAWSPEKGLMWSHVVSGISWPQRATYAGWGGSGALFVTGETYEASQKWNLAGPGGVVSEPISGDLLDVRPGPLLDPSTGTFVLFGRSGVDWRHSIRVMHRGQRAWTIDTLRFGLQPRRVYMTDVVLLVPPQ